jgi:hypothetical protein
VVLYSGKVDAVILAASKSGNRGRVGRMRSCGGLGQVEAADHCLQALMCPLTSEGPAEGRLPALENIPIASVHIYPGLLGP